MGLFGIDANSSSSSLQQNQATTQYGNAFGANTGKGATSNASGTTTISGGVKAGKGATVVISNTNTQLENSIAEGLTNIQSLLQAGQSQGGDSSGGSSGLFGLGGSGGSSKSGKGGVGGSVGDSGNISVSPTPGLDLLGGNQALNANPSNELIDAHNAGGSTNASDLPSSGFIFAPTSSDSTTGATPFPWLTVILGVGAVVGVVVAIKTFGK
jgi:hypothetical protein